MYESATPGRLKARRIGASPRPRAGRHLALLTLAVLASTVFSGSAAAAEASSPSVYVEAGRASTDTDTLTIGLRLPSQHTLWDGRIALAWDVYLSDWKADALPGGRSHFTQVGLVPMFRYRFDAGQSPWFVEGGIGVSYLTTAYRTSEKTFSTQWNFSDHVGVGRNFGADRRHELGVYVKHVSNAAIREPNPGETFVQLRYGYRF